MKFKNENKAKQLVAEIASSDYLEIVAGKGLFFNDGIVYDNDFTYITNDVDYPLIEQKLKAIVELVNGDRCDHCFIHGLLRPDSKRYQARRGLLDLVSTWLHDSRAWCVRLFGGGVPFDDTRILQSAVVPRCRFGHHGRAP